MKNWVSTKDNRIKKRGEIYWARFSKRGVRIETSLNTNNFKLAQSIVEKIEQAILTNQDYKSVVKGNEPVGNTPLIDEKWTEFILDKTNGNLKKNIKKVREKTLTEYVNFYERYFKDFWGLKTFQEISEDSWEKYIEYARNKSNKKNDLVMFNHVKYFKAFCNWAVTHDYLVKVPNIFDPINNLHEDEKETLDEDGVGKNYTDQELEIFREKSKYHKQFHLWIMMAQYMGMRSGEITQLQKDRIDLRKRVINLKIKDTKTKRKRTVPIHDAVYDILIEQIKFTESPFVFPNKVDPSRPMDKTGFKKHWDSIRAENNIAGRFHDFRHSYATRGFANKDINPFLLCESLGMSFEVARKVYIHFSDDQLSQITMNFNL